MDKRKLRKPFKFKAEESIGNNGTRELVWVITIVEGMQMHVNRNTREIILKKEV